MLLTYLFQVILILLTWLIPFVNVFIHHLPYMRNQKCWTWAGEGGTLLWSQHLVYRASKFQDSGGLHKNPVSRNKTTNQTIQQTNTSGNNNKRNVETGTDIEKKMANSNKISMNHKWYWVTHIPQLLLGILLQFFFYRCGYWGTGDWIVG